MNILHTLMYFVCACASIRLPNIIYLYLMCITNSAMIEVYIMRVSSNEKYVRNNSVIKSLFKYTYIINIKTTMTPNVYTYSTIIR